jgi:glutathione S-transferase
MKLYYFPAACSLASNIALREAGLKFELIEVDKHSKIARDGLDLNEINAKSYVPVLRLDDGEVLTECVAILQYIADRNPGAKLAPAPGTMDRYRLTEWLAFINSELHKSFIPLFRPDTPEGAKEYARANLGVRLPYLQRVLGSRTYLLGDHPTVADLYLFTVLSWCGYVKVDIRQWAALENYVQRLRTRASVLEALKSEGLLS